MAPNQNSAYLTRLSLSSLIKSATMEICVYLSVFPFSSMEICCIICQKNKKKNCCIAHNVGQLPPGFELKFNPNPEILVCDYLLPKIRGEQLPCTSAVKECDLYGSKKPDQIWEELGGLALGKGEGVFFFTTLTKTNTNFKRKNDFGGTWTGKGGGKVFSGNVNEVKKPIARWRRLVYAPPKKEEEEPPQEKSELEHCGWTVFEYTVDVEDSELAEDLFEFSSYSTQVLCQLRKQEQNHHETTTTGKRIRQSSKIENWEVQNFNKILHELTAMLDQLRINQDSQTGHVVPRSPLNPTEWTRDAILRLLDLTPDQSQVQDSQSHNPDQVQVQDSITGEVSREDYFRSNPSPIPDPMETEI